MSDPYRVHRRLVLPVDQAPHSIAENRTNQPSSSTTCSGGQTEHHERIQAHHGTTQGLKVLARDNLSSNGGTGERSGDRRSERVAAARSAKLEERIPVELDFVGGGSGGLCAKSGGERGGLSLGARV